MSEKNIQHKPECDSHWKETRDVCVCKIVTATEERIVKLLEQHYKQTKAGNTEMAYKYRAAVLACVAIVKGEDK